MLRVKIKRNFQCLVRVGLWICYVSYIFGLSQLEIAAQPYEYFEDHEELSYDLDTVQSQAKYDSSLLLSEQMLSEKQQRKQQQQQKQKQVVQQQREEEKWNQAQQQQQQQSEVKNVSEAMAIGNDDDLQPHGRAASCRTNGHKYTHGQKVSRLDPCEVCLCMDGEIFCWWEKCDKPASVQINNDFSDPYHGPTSIKSTQSYAEMCTTQRTKWQKKQRKPKKQNGYQVGTKKIEKQNEYVMQQSQQPQQQKQHKQERQQPLMQAEQHQKPFQNQQNRNQPQQNVQHVAFNQHEQGLQQQQQQQQQHIQQPHSSSKILNFPENLPALLYYDYKTEEHEHHQHLHHQQHLLHQQQQQQQRLRQQQLQQQQKTEEQQQQKKRKQAKLDASTSTASSPAASKVSDVADIGSKQVGSVADKTLYESETDSDILPVPPTKKPKVSLTTTRKTTFTPASGTAITPPTASASATKNKQLHRDIKGNRNNDNDDFDDAFHRWLTSTEFIAEENMNENIDDNGGLGANFIYETTTITAETRTTPTPTQIPTATVTLRGTAARTAINNVTQAVTATSTAIETDITAGTAAADAETVVNELTNEINALKDNNKHVEDSDSSTNIGKYAIIRSTETDYSNEVNGSVVKIDISLTTVDEQQHQQQQQQQQQKQELEQPERADFSDQHVPTMERDKLAATVDLGPYKIASAPALGVSRAYTTPDPSRQCNVMGVKYNIGDILPQDTGNCLQCICIADYIVDNIPRITCSPHNCPPLVLPDLLDATGY